MRSRILAMKIVEWIKEDAPLGDITTELIIPRGRIIRADIVLKSDRAIAACVEDLEEALRILGLMVEKHVIDGAMVERKSSIMTIAGDARDILILERTLLNLLNYCIGVATTARLFVEAARKVNPRVRIAVTRKTPPGLREIAKRAASIGGADTHRLSLSDAILIKDNHIAIVGDVEKAARIALERKSFVHRVEVEVSSAEDAVRVARLGVDIIMLDNVSPQEVRRAISMLESEGLRNKVIIEVSGGITLDNIADYASAGPDIISSSIITMRPIPIDISLEVVR